MTAVEAREKKLWNSLPICIKNRIEEYVKYSSPNYRQPYILELFKSVTPEAFMNLEDDILKLKGLGYGVEYIDRVDYVDGTDSKLIIKW